MRSPIARRVETLMSLGDALGALGSGGVMGTRRDEVPVASIVGSASRTADFDASFRPRHRYVRPMHVPLDAAGMPPVRLVQLGELYFVVDGHHRISAARRADVVSVDADVSRICTVAFASACIRSHHLASKAAERRFLERVPLPDAVRRDLWLDHPDHWARLADAVEAWGFRRALDTGIVVPSREHLAEAWWSREVLPTVDRLRSTERGLRERRVIETYWSAMQRSDEGVAL